MGACALLALAPWRAAAQVSASELPRCLGSDLDGAAREFEFGNALMEQALREARARRIDRARELATQALAHFDRQCELGDVGGYAERGAALILLGDPLRSAQAYDAYLEEHPLETLDARTRRRIEANLQPGTVYIEVEHAPPGLRAFVGGLEFGVLPRRRPLRLPYGEHRIEARDARGDVLAFAVAVLSAESPTATVRLELPEPEPAAPAPSEEPAPAADAPPPPITGGDRVDYTPWYGTTIAVTVVGLGLGIGFAAAVEERAATYNEICTAGPALGCDAVLSEREIFLGLSIAGFVFGGIGVAGLIIVIALDASQPRGAPRSERLRLGMGPGGLSLAGTF
jgi:hypothetical protein